jgi:cytochrome oxidase Cu insertion factor (SCO1/SenC/PrrC family)
MQWADRLKLILIMALFVTPALAAWITHVVWHPSRVNSYGEMLEPRVPQLGGLLDDHGQPATLEALRGKWVLVTVVDGRCGDGCRRNLYLARQTRTAQGGDRERVERAFIAAQDPGVPAEEGLHRYLAKPLALQILPASDVARTYVLDPLGRTVLRFPERPEGKGMIRDLQRLLRASKLG